MQILKANVAELLPNRYYAINNSAVKLYFILSKQFFHKCGFFSC